jgi:TetR/AcrR family transcriptional regulator, transcriptional repressor for nem operon
MSTRSDKRSRLIDAAKWLIHRQGYSQTTLADIAQKAMVPLGNVYYYFKTKDAIGEAVIAEYTVELKQQLHTLEHDPDIKHRLFDLINKGLQSLTDTLAYGCAIGSLCQELSKETNELSRATSHLMSELVEWLQQQFTSLGHREKSLVLSWYLLSQIQGMSLLATTFKDVTIIETQQQLLKTWLEKL